MNFGGGNGISCQRCGCQSSSIYLGGGDGVVGQLASGNGKVFNASSGCHHLLESAAVPHLQVFAGAVDVATAFEVIAAGCYRVVNNAAVVGQFRCCDGVVSQRRSAQLGGAGLVQLDQVDAGIVGQVGASLKKIFGFYFFGGTGADVNNRQHVISSDITLGKLRELRNALVGHVGVTLCDQFNPQLPLAGRQGCLG